MIAQRPLKQVRIQIIGIERSALSGPPVIGDSDRKTADRITGRKIQLLETFPQAGRAPGSDGKSFISQSERRLNTRPRSYLIDPLHTYPLTRSAPTFTTTPDWAFKDGAQVENTIAANIIRTMDKFFFIAFHLNGSTTHFFSRTPIRFDESDRFVRFSVQSPYGDFLPTKNNK